MAENECDRLFVICQGCLSSDRKVFILNTQDTELFLILRGEKHPQEDAKPVQLCWECSALLHKIKVFKLQIKNAQSLLLLYLQTYYNKNNQPKSLSKLETKINNNFNHEWVYKDHSINEEIPKPLNNIDENCETKLDISIKNETLVKNEYYSNNETENEPYTEEIEYKIDNEQITKRKGKNTYWTSMRSYEKYATITKIPLSLRNLEKFYVKLVSDVKQDCNTKCTDCNITFKQSIDYQKHLNFHHNKSEYPMPCLLCKNVINTEVDMKNHWNNHLSVLKCKICSELCISKETLKRHLKEQHKRKYRCNSCTQEFGNLREFRRHYRAAHETAICDYCGLKFGIKIKLESHIKTFHIPANCIQCNRTFKSRRSLRNHAKLYHLDIMADNKKELCYCVECDIQYPNVHKYKKHLQQSVKHKPKEKVRVPCSECDKVFSKTTYKNNHYRLVHMKKTKHYCEICNKYFANGYGIRKHIQVIHKKMPLPKDKICDLCGRGFSTNRILTNHRRTHTGERPFACKYCPASFAQSTAMKSHQKTQHKNVLNTDSK